MRFSLRFPATPPSDATRARSRRSLLLAVCLMAVLPLAWRGTSCGQDFDFHLQSWLDVVSHWHHGILYPHWAGSANYLTGEPRFVFYPPFSWTLGGLLGLVFPWPWTPVAYTLLAFLGAGFAMRAMARAWMSPDQATLAACLYVVNPYLLFVAYDRAALAELLAATWIPLLVLYALRERPSFLPLSLTVAALWLTNLPAAVMGSYTLALIVAVAALRERADPEKSWRLVARSIGAFALGVGLSGFWLVPAFYEERWVQIHRALGPLMRVEDSFLFRSVPLLPGAPADQSFDTIYHNGILILASWIAVALIVGALVGAWFSRRKRNALWAPLVVLGLVIVFLQFPWSDPLWRHVPELKYLQFPWRWLLVLALVFAALLGLALRRELATRRTVAIRAMILLALACGMAALSTFLFWQPCDDEDNISAQMAALHATGFAGTDEYTPLGAANDAIQQGLPVLRLLSAADAEESSGDDNPPWKGDASAEIAGAVAISDWTPEHIAAQVGTVAPGFAVFRILDYPAWRIALNGAELRERPHRSDGLIVLPLAAGTNRIDIRWRLTADQRIGSVLSLLALAITLALAWKGRRRADARSIRYHDRNAP